MDKINNYTPGPLEIWGQNEKTEIGGFHMIGSSDGNTKGCTAYVANLSDAKLYVLAPTLYEQHFKMLEALKGCQMVMKLLGYSTIEIEQTIKECEL